MNESGRPVGQLLRFYSLPPERLIVVHDELDLPFGGLRLKVGGGHGGHNGVRDIATVLGTPEFPRVRVGIGRPPGRQPAADFVLRNFAAEERTALPNLLVDAADAVEALATDGLEAAQARFNGPRP
jgi:peptidyl-tRNA hydrolase, PTH1 family